MYLFNNAKRFMFKLFKSATKTIKKSISYTHIKQVKGNKINVQRSDNKFTGHDALCEESELTLKVESGDGIVFLETEGSLYATETMKPLNKSISLEINNPISKSTKSSKLQGTNLSTLHDKFVFIAKGVDVERSKPHFKNKNKSNAETVYKYNLSKTEVSKITLVTDDKIDSSTEITGFILKPNTKKVSNAIKKEQFKTKNNYKKGIAPSNDYMDDDLD